MFPNGIIMGGCGLRFIVHAWNRDSYERLVKWLESKGITIVSRLPQLNTVVVDIDPNMVGTLYATGLVRLVEASYPFGLGSA